MVFVKVGELRSDESKRARAIQAEECLECVVETKGRGVMTHIETMGCPCEGEESNDANQLRKGYRVVRRYFMCVGVGVGVYGK